MYLFIIVCIEDDSFRRYRRLRASSDSNNLPGIPFFIVTVSVDDYFAILNCSTPQRVSHDKLDWYFKTRTSLKSPRSIWLRGRSITDRYTAYSPDQFQHYLQIKPVNYNDSGTYICIDQTTGFHEKVELVVRKFSRIYAFYYIIHTFQFTLERISIFTFFFFFFYFINSKIYSLKLIFLSLYPLKRKMIM